MSKPHHGSACTDFIEDMREEEPAIGGAGFQGKTQAELWAHICKTNGHIGNIVRALESDAKDRQKASLESPKNELPGVITLKMKERITALKQELQKLGLGHKVVDNVLRVEVMRLNSEYPCQRQQFAGGMSDAEFATRTERVRAAGQNYGDMDLGELASQTGRGK